MTRMDELADRLSALLDTINTARDEAAALAIPPYVVSGEIIESAWGNAVVDELARQEIDHVAATNALRARVGHTYHQANAAIIPIAPDTWTLFGVGTVVLPPTAAIYDLLVTVSVQINATGYNRLIASINGTQVAGAGESTAITITGTTSCLVHQAYTQFCPGSFTIEAQALAQSGGGLGPGWGSCVAIPVG